MSPPSHPQDVAQAHSLRDPESFWGQEASLLHWHKAPDAILKRTTKKLSSSKQEHPHWQWFPGGQISTCYNMLDRHVLAGRGDEPAVIYDSPVTNTKQRLSYAELLAEVKAFAGVLRQEGVKKGDVVLVYMPMIPAALVGILAINRLGAVHAVVFGGFAPAALAQRIDACRPTALLTASCGVIDLTKPPTPYRELVREAVSLAKWKPPRTIIWQRQHIVGPRWNVSRTDGERDWQKLTSSCRARGISCEDAVPVGANDPVYIIYTSGTTGLPKGVVREAGGHAVGLHTSIRYLMGVHGPGDVMACLSDIGWVVGHSFTVYAPLLAGAATVLFEGKPVGTPDASTFWRLVQDYKVTALFTAPTALRAIRRDDPNNKHISAIGDKNGLRSLRALFLAGERSEPAIITMYEELLTRYGADGAKVVDNWWSSESGSPISGVATAPHVAVKGAKQQPMLEIKAGSAGKAMPGFDVRAVDDDGNEVKRGTMGNIVMALPLAPTAFTTLWEDEERFYKGYLKRFNGKWLDTGDAGVIDEQGYISIMARSDDIINVAAHRLSTGSLEQAITSHPSVTEACVVGIPDSLKGQMPFAIVASSSPLSDDELFREINDLVRKQVGAIASLGGMIRGQGIIPRTRSGKTLRRVVRELLENAVHGEFEKAVNVPSTVEDAAVVDVCREKVKAYFKEKGGKHGSIEARAKL